MRITLSALALLALAGGAVPALAAHDQGDSTMLTAGRESRFATDGMMSNTAVSTAPTRAVAPPAAAAASTGDAMWGLDGARSPARR